MKANSNKAIAKKAYDLVYGLEILLGKAVRDNDHSWVPWMAYHGMTTAVESFALILAGRKAMAEYADDLVSVKVRMLDLRCALDKDSSFFSPSQAKALAEYASHVFFSIAHGYPLKPKYIELLMEAADRNDPHRIVA